jgi:hypothetical protein
MSPWSCYRQGIWSNLGNPVYERPLVLGINYPAAETAGYLKDKGKVLRAST